LQGGNGLYKFPADAGFICEKVPVTAAPLRAEIKDKACKYPPQLTSPVRLLLTCPELSMCSQLSVTSTYALSMLVSKSTLVQASYYRHLHLPHPPYIKPDLHKLNLMYTLPLTTCKKMQDA